MERYPTRPLFRNSRGKPWTRNAIRCRFRNLRAKLPRLKGVVSCTYRHSFVTDAPENGVGVAQVAELLRHTSTHMVMQHYQHLREARAPQAGRQPGDTENGEQAAPPTKAGLEDGSLLESHPVGGTPALCWLSFRNARERRPDGGEEPGPRGTDRLARIPIPRKGGAPVMTHQLRSDSLERGSGRGIVGAFVNVFDNAVGAR
jgi:hypothetical protein